MSNTTISPYSIKNQFLCVKISSYGAEMVSIRTNDGHEWLWQGDADVWDRHSPVLFPWTGRIKKQFFVVNNKRYCASLHGFIKDRVHTVQFHESDSIIFYYQSTKEDLKIFSFPFYVEQKFYLKKNTVIHEITIQNSGKTQLYFGLGFHPSFIFPFELQNGYKNYRLVFSAPENPEEVLFSKNLLTTHTTRSFLLNNNSIPITDDMFKNDSICLTHLQSSSVNLVGENTKKSLTIGLAGFDYVILWANPQPPLQFLCIEPWHTLPDFEDAPFEWTKKQNLLCLEPKKKFTTNLPMTFHTK